MSGLRRLVSPLDRVIDPTTSVTTHPHQSLPREIQSGGLTTPHLKILTYTNYRSDTIPPPDPSARSASLQASSAVAIRTQAAVPTIQPIPLPTSLPVIATSLPALPTSLPAIATSLPVIATSLPATATFLPAITTSILPIAKSFPTTAPISSSPKSKTTPHTMQDEYANRQNMHLTLLQLLENPSHQGAWKNQKPTAFATRAGELILLIRSLTELLTQQQATTTGHAETKEREEQELENLAHEIGQTLAYWYEENGREGDSAQIDLPLSTWQRLRDTELINKATLLHQKLTAALASHPTDLAEYNLTPADATLLAKELADFEAITAAPFAAISRRRALTLALRPKFREVSLLLQKMDRLLPRLRRNPGGPEFAAIWTTSRLVRDLRTAAPATPNPATPTA